MSCTTTGSSPWPIRMSGSVISRPIPQQLTIVVLRMPTVTKVQAKKEALAGAMRITIEGSSGAWYVPMLTLCSFPSLSTQDHFPVGPETT